MIGGSNTQIFLSVQRHNVYCIIKFGFCVWEHLKLKPTISAQKYKKNNGWVQGAFWGREIEYVNKNGSK